MHTKKFYTCKWDRPFKEVLLKEENRDILQKILETTLKIKVYEIKELNIEKRVGNVYVKGKRVDVLLFTEIGYIGIELNARYHKYLHVRNLAYHCDNYAHYTLRGEEYKENVKIIQINFTYGMGHDIQEEIKVYEMQNESGEKYVDNFLLYEFNMDKLMQFWYSKEEKKIEEYKYLIMLDLGLKELEKIAKKDKLVEKYMEEIEKLNESPEFHIYMTEEEDRRKCLNTEVSIAKKEGSRQTALDVAKKLLHKLSLEEIQEITNLSIEEIESLR